MEAGRSGEAAGRRCWSEWSLGRGREIERYDVRSAQWREQEMSQGAAGLRRGDRRRLRRREQGRCHMRPSRLIARGREAAVVLVAEEDWGAVGDWRRWLSVRGRWPEGELRGAEESAGGKEEEGRRISVSCCLQLGETERCYVRHWRGRKKRSSRSDSPAPVSSPGKENERRRRGKRRG